MEGSNKEVKEYEYLAKYYDYLLGDEEAFNFWLEYINAKDYHTVLELASGSGVLAGILKKQGKEVTASDISKEMKEVATNNFDGEYLILNMIDFDLHKKYDLILCVCDSINYLYDEELEQMFKSVYKHLNDGGRFIFDMHNPKRLKEFDEEYIEEGQIDENVYYQWTINSDTFDRTVNEHFTFYTPEGMIQEQHTQNVFEVDDVKNKLENVGLESEVVMDFIEDEKILFIGTK
ncbi:MAG: class I SAM-dependent methyltransferase [Solobacterium sp.]|nr:class I SAM-dependent methyltransferase [Solobacterium sp.]MDY2952561.1 class I SAM-dependent methyltransferase [Erysipelotrichaceae bacterium]MCI6697234.1 class I SAM-dependent methyltransferase [Solobacterium sp.]MCI6846410.1 class I SAM-dependent methyltransferase [Solobacterium sp.]MCI6878323.1 class I SAM-dependent methyltransferase [Solobacterium sp.]